MFSLFVKKFVEGLQTVNKNLNEAKLKELDKMTPSPFTKEEEEWLEKSFTYYYESQHFHEIERKVAHQDGQN